MPRLDAGPQRRRPSEQPRRGAYTQEMLIPGEVLLVSGPPGVGKTEVSLALASTASMGVHLESDWFFRSILSGITGPHLPEAHSQNTAIVDAATDAAASLASSGYAVVWDGVVGPWFLDRAARRLASRGIGLRCLVLRPSHQTTLDRVRSRDRTAEVSGASTLFDQFVELGDLESHVVDTDADPDVVLERCHGMLRQGGLQIELDEWVDDRWPVSVKGVLGWGGQYVVLRNRRGEWELPGGRLDASDAGPVEALKREMSEELGLEVEVGPIVDSWVYEVEGKRVLILTYGCQAEQPAELSISDEHIEVALMDEAQLDRAVFPAGYLRSIRAGTSRVPGFQSESGRVHRC